MNEVVQAPDPYAPPRTGGVRPAVVLATLPRGRTTRIWLRGTGVNWPPRCACCMRAGPQQTGSISTRAGLRCTLGYPMCNDCVRHMRLDRIGIAIGFVVGVAVLCVFAWVMAQVFNLVSVRLTILVGVAAGMGAVGAIRKLIVPMVPTCAGRGSPVTAPPAFPKKAPAQESAEGAATRERICALEDSIRDTGFAIDFANRRYLEEFAKANGGVPPAPAA
jgi:hypothetical protein